MNEKTTINMTNEQDKKISKQFADNARTYALNYVKDTENISQHDFNIAYNAFLAGELKGCTIATQFYGVKE
ncbi:hypothetical protein [Methanobrevibacter sp.]|uniref:hypothetical protein n=1 Tax=Methanobrevibacter sp. TaxID=66852 RepID=UPI003890A7E1